MHTRFGQTERCNRDQHHDSRMTATARSYNCRRSSLELPSWVGSPAGEMTFGTGGDDGVAGSSYISKYLHISATT